MLRVIIFVAACIEILYFSLEAPLAIAVLFEADAGWINIGLALTVGVISPLLALTALILSLIGWRVGLAATFVIIAPFVHWLPVIGFIIGIMIYGF
jgi:hypothetical protein